MQDQSTRACAFEACERRTRRNALCSAHDHQMKTKGTLSPLRKRAPADMSEVERFWFHVDSTGIWSECWEWDALRTPKGYGSFMTSTGRTTAHRYAYELEHGPLDRWTFVLHHCDNPPCCNPAHLFAGTHTENMHDMLAKGRGRWGPNRPSRGIV